MESDELQLEIHKLINENQTHPAEAFKALTSMLASGTLTLFILTGTDLTETIIASYREAIQEMKNAGLVEKYKEKYGLKK